jgi:hypothetical protein
MPQWNGQHSFKSRHKPNFLIRGKVKKLEKNYTFKPFVTSYIKQTRICSYHAVSFCSTWRKRSNSNKQRTVSRRFHVFLKTITNNQMKYTKYTRKGSLYIWYVLIRKLLSKEQHCLQYPQALLLEHPIFMSENDYRHYDGCFYKYIWTIVECSYYDWISS